MITDDCIGNYMFSTDLYSYDVNPILSSYCEHYSQKGILMIDDQDLIIREQEGSDQLLLGNRADPGLNLLSRTNKRPTVLALSATTCAQVAVSPETAMGCRRIMFLHAERGITVP